jgi:hypothetical protein
MSKVQANLIERYNLGAKVPIATTATATASSAGVDKGKGKERAEGQDQTGAIGDEQAPSAVSSSPAAASARAQQNGGKWGDTREARERGLRERKEKMILEARR